MPKKLTEKIRRKKRMRKTMMMVGKHLMQKILARMTRKKIRKKSMISFLVYKTAPEKIWTGRYYASLITKIIKK